MSEIAGEVKRDVRVHQDEEAVYLGFSRGGYPGVVDFGERQLVPSYALELDFWIASLESFLLASSILEVSVFRD